MLIILILLIMFTDFELSVQIIETEDPCIKLLLLSNERRERKSVFLTQYFIKVRK